MSTYTQIYYHIVFSTKYRVPCLRKDERQELYRYMAGVLKKKKCKPYLINGVEDHVHIFASIHPTQCLSNVVKDVKLASSSWMKETKRFPQFTNWQDGYSAFTHSYHEKKTQIDYIDHQEQHHKKVSFKEELKEILLAAGIELNEKYFQ